MKTDVTDFSFIIDILDSIQPNSTFEDLRIKCAQYNIKLSFAEYDRLAYLILHNIVTLKIKLDEQKKIRTLYIKRDGLLLELSKLNNTIFRKGKYNATKEKVELLNIEITALERGNHSRFDDTLDLCTRIAENMIDMLKVTIDENSVYHLESEIKDHFQKIMDMQLA